VSKQLYDSAVQQNQAPKAGEVVPDKVKELRELYPEIADAMEQYIEHKVGNPVQQAERIATEKAAIVAQQVQALQYQQHVNTILAKHPDLFSITKSPDAKQWFDGLDPVAKRGAQYVISYGTAQDVIHLLDQYKMSKAAGTTQLNNSAGVNTLANRVVNAMGVRSGKTEPTPVAQPQQATPLTQEQAFERLAREYEKDPYSLR
jgi:hypothetical protein